MRQHVQSPKLAFTPCAAFLCPAQVLVIDRPTGPASILLDTISLLLEREVSLTSVEEHTDALRALDFFAFNVVVVGLEAQDTVQLSILPWIHEQYPDLPIIVIGQDLPRLYKQYAWNYGAVEVLNMPERAADLKALVQRMAQQYLLQPANY